MERAIKKAQKAASEGEVPVGAVILSPDDTILSACGNKMISLNDPTAHAEILAIRQACQKQESSFLINCKIYITLEPCLMCAAALAFSRISFVYYGASDTKRGAVHHGFFEQKQCCHRPTIYDGFCEDECITLMKDFFETRRS